jgi:hypothetical protein
MAYKNPHNRIRLNKTEAINLLEFLRHALHCSKRSCGECAEAEAYMNKLERLMRERSA